MRRQKRKVKVKSSGQECPLHMGFTLVKVKFPALSLQRTERQGRGSREC